MRPPKARSCARCGFPNSLPYLFTALKLASTLSLIGAIVAEYFGGSASVLGRMIVQSASALKFDITWAAVSLAAVPASSSTR